MSVNHRIGRVLATERRKSGLSLRDASNYTGIPPSTISKMESGVESATTVGRVISLLCTYGADLSPHEANLRSLVHSNPSANAGWDLVFNRGCISLLNDVM